MDPQGLLTDQEQMMLGAQQVALLQIHDSELETKAQQQHAMLEEEKLLEAQHEALAIHQQQRIMVPDPEQEKEVELHRLQTMALTEKVQEMLQQPLPATQPHIEGPPPAPMPLMSQPAQPVVFIHAGEPSQPGPPGIAMPTQTVLPPPPLMSAPVLRPPAPAAEPPFSGRPPLQEPQFPSQRPPLTEPQFPPSRGPPSGPPEPSFPGRGPPPMSESAPFSVRGPPPVAEAARFGGRGPPPMAEGPRFGGRVPPPIKDIGPPQLTPPGEGVPPTLKKDVEPTTPSGSVPDTSPAISAQSLGEKEIKLPQALEKVLAFKDVRAQQVGVKPDNVDQAGEIMQAMDEKSRQKEPRQEEFVYIEEEEEQRTKSSKKESKNKKRKKKKKRAKARKMESKVPEPEPVGWEKLVKMNEDVQVEYVEEELQLDRAAPGYFEFTRIFKAFKIAEPESEEAETTKVETKKEEVPIKARGLISDDDSDDDSDNDRSQEDDKMKLSKKKQKKLNRLSVAELKQLVSRPDVVEMHDVTARDPKLLVNLKATRNSVTVPRHWCFKRKYLQGKRGIEKPPFDLPDFIKATGIMEMRQALQEKEDQKTMKTKMRERVRPKMGKIDIDYKKLHDAFFKWQVKPKLSIHGDLYYEGKEFETRLREKKPGNLSDELRTALGMPIGPNADKYPPPWLIAMQRYGPPPSYPNLKIPGLTAPIPETCSFGYHAGGWGKPPVDEQGKPLYGDVFGTQTTETEVPVQEEDIDKTNWGELESESEEEEESEEESEEEEADSGLVTPGDAGLVTPSGVTSIPVGVETPEMIELRKRRIEDAMDQGGDTPALYQVLAEKKTAVGAAMMGSAHVYDLAGAKKVPEKPAAEVVEVALNPDELDLDAAAMQAKYDQTMREQQSQLEKEDLSDMVAEHAAKQQKKRKKQQQDGKAQKKYKEFKF